MNNLIRNKEEFSNLTNFFFLAIREIQSHSRSKSFSISQRLLPTAARARGHGRTRELMVAADWNVRIALIWFLSKHPYPFSMASSVSPYTILPLCPGELSLSDQWGGEGRDWCNKPCTSAGQRCQARATGGKRGKGPADGWEADCGVMGYQCPQAMGIPADSLILSLSCDLLMLINELRMNSLGRVPTLTLAMQGILNPRIRRTRGSGCDPNSENISLLTALNPDSDMETTLDTISKKNMSWFKLY